jgi:hypothetical protein
MSIVTPLAHHVHSSALVAVVRPTLALGGNHLYTEYTQASQSLAGGDGSRYVHLKAFGMCSCPAVRASALCCAP